MCSSIDLPSPSTTMCQICKENEATIDGKTIAGSWALMCEKCHEHFGVGFGMGKGTSLLPEDEGN